MRFFDKSGKYDTDNMEFIKGVNTNEFYRAGVKRSYEW